MSAKKLDISTLVFDEALYPRQNIDEQHVREMMHALEAGVTLPPIVVAKGSLKIVDGAHRYHAHLRRGAAKIEAVINVYANDAELFQAAVTMNSGVGLKLGQADTLKVMDVSESLGLKEIVVAGMLRTSIAHLRALKPRYATLAEAQVGIAEGRKDWATPKRIPLKGSVRHLSGAKLTQRQVDALGSAPGQSYLLTTRQLIQAIEHGLLPPQDNHPVLWSELARLSGLLDELLSEADVAA